MGESGVSGRRGGAVKVGIEAVDGAEAGVVDVAVDVVREQRRDAGEGDDQEDDRSPDDSAPELRR